MGRIIEKTAEISCSGADEEVNLLARQAEQSNIQNSNFKRIKERMKERKLQNRTCNSTLKTWLTESCNPKTNISIRGMLQHILHLVRNICT